MINGFFGQISGPFSANEQVITKIQEQCLYPIKYISKIGITYTGNSSFLESSNFSIIINNIQFQLGKTKMLELEDVQITSIKFKEDINDKIYIDYQYIKE